MNIKFLKPAKLGNFCKILTKTLEGGSDYRVKFDQKIELDGNVLVQAVVDIICLDENFKLRAFPVDLFK